jgi:hypothetical protein
MKTNAALMLAAVVLGISLTAQFASAQDKEKSDKATETVSAPKVKPLQPYRLDFAFNEIEDGKVINSRHYSMNVTGGGSNDIKIGTRVPVASSSGQPGQPAQFQYIDVGTSINVQLRERGDEFELVVRSDVSNIDLSIHAENVNFKLLDDPIIRQIRIEGDTLLVVGKPILVGSVDDPNSKRQFQLEATATKLR